MLGELILDLTLIMIFSPLFSLKHLYLKEATEKTID